MKYLDNFKNAFVVFIQQNKTGIKNENKEQIITLVESGNIDSLMGMIILLFLWSGISTGLVFFATGTMLVAAESGSTFIYIALAIGVIGRFAIVYFCTKSYKIKRWPKFFLIFPSIAFIAFLFFVLMDQKVFFKQIRLFIKYLRKEKKLIKTLRGLDSV